MRASQRFLKGLIYFPLQTNILSNERIRVLISEHGNDGFACLIFLWCQIYGNEYYRKFGPREMRLFCNDHKFNLPDLERILNTCFEEELFDPGMYNKYQILTSESIQEIWVDVTYRRTVLDIIEEYLMLKISDIPKHRRVHLINLSGKIMRHATDKEGKKIIREDKVKVPKSEKVKKSKEKIAAAVAELSNEKPYLMPEVTDQHFYDEDLTEDVLGLFELGGMLKSPHKSLFIHFTTVLNNTNILDKFREQFAGYKEYTQLTQKRYRHKFENFIGHQHNRFEDGRWLEENWLSKAIIEKDKQAQKNGFNGHGKVVESKSEQALSGHENFSNQFKPNE